MLTIQDVMDMMKKKDVAGLLQALQYQGDMAVRAESASSLGQLGDPQAVEALIATLERDSDPYVRSLAARALGELGDPRAREPLMKCIANDTLDVGLEASRAQFQLEANIANGVRGRQKSNLADASIPRPASAAPKAGAETGAGVMPDLQHLLDYETINLQNICFVCKENPSDPKSGISVRLERKTMVSSKTGRTETINVTIPRCKRCLSINKRDNKENAVISALAMISGPGAYYIAYKLDQPDLVGMVACFSVPIMIFIIGLGNVFRRRAKLPEAEKALYNKAANPKVDDYPAIAQLLAQDYKIT